MQKKDIHSINFINNNSASEVIMMIKECLNAWTWCEDCSVCIFNPYIIFIAQPFCPM